MVPGGDVTINSADQGGTVWAELKMQPTLAGGGWWWMELLRLLKVVQIKVVKSALLSSEFRRGISPLARVISCSSLK